MSDQGSGGGSERNGSSGHRDRDSKRDRDRSSSSKRREHSRSRDENQRHRSSSNRDYSLDRCEPREPFHRVRRDGGNGHELSRSGGNGEISMSLSGSGQAERVRDAVRPSNRDYPPVPREEFGGRRRSERDDSISRNGESSKRQRLEGVLYRERHVPSDGVFGGENMGGVGRADDTVFRGYEDIGSEREHGGRGIGRGGYGMGAGGSRGRGFGRGDDMLEAESRGFRACDNEVGGGRRGGRGVFGGDDEVEGRRHGDRGFGGGDDEMGGGRRGGRGFGGGDDEMGGGRLGGRGFRRCGDGKGGGGRGGRDANREIDETGAVGPGGRGSGSEDGEISTSPGEPSLSLEGSSEMESGGRGGRGIGHVDGEMRGGARGARGARRGARGRGEGRGARRGRREEDYDLVITRPQNSDGSGLRKKANLVNGNKAVILQGNFFRVDQIPNWCIYHYRVDFNPEETDTRIKKKLVKGHSEKLGAYIFDGSSLYVSHRITPDPMILYTVRDTDQEKIELSIRLVAELAPTDVMYLQFFNIIVRKCLEAMELEEMGRHFYDRRQAIRIDAHHLELWPGFKTSMRNHEHSILLGVEITHKVLRLDNCLQVMNNLRQRSNDEPSFQRRMREDLVGSIVMTIYNRKTYRIDDVDWETTPSSTFDMRGEQVTFIEYFKRRYGLHIRDGRQPMLISRPKKRDFHRGMTGPIMLIPELCQMTGLTDEMRANNNLMRALATHLHTDPVRRVQKLREFMQKLKGIPTIQDELKRWGLKFQDRLVDFEGHVIPKENVLFGDQQHEVPNDRYDWGQAFRNKPMLSSIPLRIWVVIVPSRDANSVDKLVNSMQRVARPLRFMISNPSDVRRLGETRPNDYAKAVDQVMNEFGNRLQMIFVILPRQVNDIYAAVKKRACIEFGIPSQCFVAKNAHNERGMMSICTKVVVQMNAKLGGEPWSIQIPLKKLMIVGFDVYHCGKRRGSSVGAMVATTSSSQAKYFSTVSYHSSRDDLSEKMGADFTKCLHAFQKANQDLPDRIIMYRDGVGDGQLKYVYETELKKIQESLTSVYSGAGRDVPKFTFIVVTKRINTRIFALDNGRPTNPNPGTVADDEITLPERYDFYLVSQYSRQGTVAPVSYNVLYDRQGLDADKMQRLTFKLCHMYFNWSGTVTVPAPCQYAHKLAYLTGLSLGGPSHEKLSNLLYYL